MGDPACTEKMSKEQREEQEMNVKAKAKARANDMVTWKELERQDDMSEISNLDMMMGCKDAPTMGRLRLIQENKMEGQFSKVEEEEAVVIKVVAKGEASSSCVEKLEEKKNSEAKNELGESEASEAMEESEASESPLGDKQAKLDSLDELDELEPKWTRKQKRLLKTKAWTKAKKKSKAEALAATKTKDSRDPNCVEAKNAKKDKRKRAKARKRERKTTQEASVDSDDI